MLAGLVLTAGQVFACAGAGDTSSSAAASIGREDTTGDGGSETEDSVSEPSGDPTMMPTTMGVPPNCGDGIVDPDEECDGSPGIDCAALGWSDGTLACGADCQFDDSACNTCGDGMRTGAELCDGADLGGQTCEAMGLGAGALACLPDCTFDTGACTGMCAEPSSPPGGNCPAVCDVCDQGVCTIFCNEGGECDFASITCPPDFNCRVACTQPGSCFTATIQCPPSHDCAIECTHADACEQATISCGTGLCSIFCADFNDSCRETNLRCGDKACTATCEPGNDDPPVVDCGPSCDCTTC